MRTKVHLLWLLFFLAPLQGVYSQSLLLKPNLSKLAIPWEQVLSLEEPPLLPWDEIWTKSFPRWLSQVELMAISQEKESIQLLVRQAQLVRLLLPKPSPELLPWVAQSLSHPHRALPPLPASIWQRLTEWQKWLYRAQQLYTENRLHESWKLWQKLAQRKNPLLRSYALSRQGETLRKWEESGLNVSPQQWENLEKQLSFTHPAEVVAVQSLLAHYLRTNPSQAVKKANSWLQQASPLIVHVIVTTLRQSPKAITSSPTTPLGKLLWWHKSSYQQTLRFHLSPQEKRELLHFPPPLLPYAKAFLASYALERRQLVQAFWYFQELQHLHHPFLSPYGMFWGGITLSQLGQKQESEREREKLSQRAQKLYQKLIALYPFSPFALDSLEELFLNSPKRDLRLWRQHLQAFDRLPLTPENRARLFRLFHQYFDRHPEELLSFTSFYLPEYLFHNTLSYTLRRRFRHHPLWVRAALRWCAQKTLLRTLWPSQLTEKDLEEAKNWQKATQDCSRQTCQLIQLLTSYILTGTFPQDLFHQLQRRLPSLAVQLLQGELQPPSQESLEIYLSLARAPQWRRWAKYRAAIIARWAQPLLAVHLLQELGYSQDATFLVDALLSYEELEEYFRASSQSPLALYTLATYAMRSGDYRRAKELFFQLLQKKSLAQEIRSLARTKVQYLAKLSSLTDTLQSGSPSQRRQALWQLAKLYENNVLLFYNRLLWKGRRVAYVCQYFPEAPQEEWPTIRAYQKSHNTLERALELYSLLMEEVPPKERPLVQKHLQSCQHRLAHQFNSYYIWWFSLKRSVDEKLEKHH